MSSPIIGVTEQIRTALLETLQSNLPTLLAAQGGPIIAAWLPYLPTAFPPILPLVAIDCRGWRQPEAGFSAAGADSVGLRLYDFTIFCALEAPDAPTLETAASQVLDALAALLDDATKRTLGLENVFDLWPTAAALSEKAVRETSELCQVAKVDVTVSWWHQIATQDA
jgi:hypothetical protein